MNTWALHGPSFDNENNLPKPLQEEIMFFCAPANIIYHPNSLTHFWTMREKLLRKRTIDFAWLKFFHLLLWKDIKSHFIFTMCINYGKGHELDEMKIFHASFLTLTFLFKKRIIVFHENVFLSKSIISMSYFSNGR